ncbi:MAG: hypothetical protein ACQGVC_18660 [Myxococcota bacterium]
MRKHRNAWRRRGLVLLAALQVACASTPYSLEPRPENDLTLRLAPGEPQIERGEPNAWVDGFGHWFFSLPSKLVLLDWRVNDHDVSVEVEQALGEYLRRNGLCNTKVRINQYAPGGEWKRLFRNREMPGGWRYTLGLLSVSFYTIFPDRLFAGFPFIGGGDAYNPYTNTISIYSNRRPIALHEGGHAKDFAGVEGRHWKGLYAGSRAVPFAGLLVALYQEAVATNDALSWDLATATSRESKRAYRSLYPAYGTYLGGTAQSGASFFTGGWILYAIQYGIVAVGHVAGQTRALFVADRDRGLEPDLVAPELLEPEAVAELIEASGVLDDPPLEDPGVHPCEPGPGHG